MNRSPHSDDAACQRHRRAAVRVAWTFRPPRSDVVRRTPVNIESAPTTRSGGIAVAQTATRATLDWARRTIGEFRFGKPADLDDPTRAVEIGVLAETAGYPLTAAAFFRRALVLDRDCTLAIAGLGRVQFHKP